MAKNTDKAQLALGDHAARQLVMQPRQLPAFYNYSPLADSLTSMDSC